MINFRQAQTRLKAKGLYAGKIDGDFGPLSYAALLSYVADRTIGTDISASFALNLPAYGVDTTPNRLAGFLGQTAMESGGYQYTREVWGPTPAQKRYDQPGNALGNKPGDGYAMRGAGWLEVTGRHWFDVIGHSIGVDLIAHPECAGEPGISTLISLEWWKRNAANDVADTADFTRLSKLVNGGVNGLSQRLAYTAKALEILA